MHHEIARNVTIEVYVESKEYKIMETLPMTGHRRGSLRIRFPFRETGIKVATTTYPSLSEKDSKVKKLVQEFANTQKLKISVYDTSKTRNEFRAFWKGVRETPTVIIGKEKLTGEITEEQLIKALRAQT